jgi:transposase
MSLPQEEIKKRLVRLSNLEGMYARQRVTIVRLKEENKALKMEVASLKLVVAEQQKTINALLLRVEELSVMVFGRKKPPRNIDQHDNDVTPPKPPVARLPDSYKRPIPKDEEVTETKPHPISLCVCGAPATKKRRRIFYEEDIPIPTQKIVIKHIVEQAWCPRCRKWESAMPLPSATVMLGDNVRKYICYLSIMCRLSFSQIKNLLQDTWNIHVSEGEISNTIAGQAQKLRPLYEQIKAAIQAEPSLHLDETSWKLFNDQDTNYSWIMSGGQSKESIFLIGENRGGGNLEKLLGQNYDGTVITDDYGAYKKLKKHQLCWAHLIRKFRDLAVSGELSESEHQHCKQEYQTLMAIFDDVKNHRIPAKYEHFSERLRQLSAIKPLDPRKLVKTKTTLAKNIPHYLTCLSDPKIPMTNNQAERSLRHLVLKRKISFGSFAKRTAENLAILMSVLLSLKQRHQANFFLEYVRV